MIEFEAMMYSILKKYGLYDIRDEYIDLCYIGYAKALKKYDKTKSKLDTHIYICIKNEILSQLRKEKRQKRNGNEISIEYYRDYKNYNFNETIADKFDMELNIEKIESESKLYEALNKLSKKERFIICCLYGFCKCNYTQEELANKLNISQAQISRIKDNCLTKLRGMIQ